MSKKCLKCGCELSDDSPSYCPNCIKEEIEKAKGGNKESTNAEYVLAIIAFKRGTYIRPDTCVLGHNFYL